MTTITAQDVEEKVVEFPHSDEITMDKAVRQIVESLFDYDNDTGYLTVVINRGKDNEATVEVMLRVTAINSTRLDNDITDEEVA